MDDIKLACGCFESKHGRIHHLGEKGDYQVCVWHGLQKIVKEYDSPYELWRDMKNAGSSITLF